MQCVASISYELENGSTICLKHIKIYERSARNKGLGKILFTFFMNNLQNKNPHITTVILQAMTLDSVYLPQEVPERFNRKNLTTSYSQKHCYKKMAGC